MWHARGMSRHPTRRQKSVYSTWRTQMSSIGSPRDTQSQASAVSVGEASEAKPAPVTSSRVQALITGARSSFITRKHQSSSHGDQSSRRKDTHRTKRNDQNILPIFTHRRAEISGNNLNHCPLALRCCPVERRRPVPRPHRKLRAIHAHKQLHDLFTHGNSGTECSCHGRVLHGSNDPAVLCRGLFFGNAKSPPGTIRPAPCSCVCGGGCLGDHPVARAHEHTACSALVITSCSGYEQCACVFPREGIR